MNCCNHPHSSALGICRVCCRGVCASCAAELGDHLACKGAHEDAAAALDGYARHSASVMRGTRTARFLVPIFFGACGLIFLVDRLRQEILLNFASSFGAAFILLALAILATSRGANDAYAAPEN